MNVIIQENLDEQRIAEIRSLGGALDAVLQERVRQVALKAAGKFKYGCEDDELDDFKCYSILGEEFGEVGHEVNESINRPVDLQKLHDELIQVAAVAVAWSERVKRQIDAAKWRPLAEVRVNGEVFKDLGDAPAFVAHPKCPRASGRHG